jgi:hypothetical protein
VTAADGATKQRSLVNDNVQLIGFYSNKHQGVFTTMGRKTVMHAFEVNGQAGHVDQLQIKHEMRVFFPSVIQAADENI